MSQKQWDDLEKALQHLVNAPSQDSNKHKFVKQWFQTEFKVPGRASKVAAANQAYNRPPEQFKHRDPHVIFVYGDNATLRVLKQEVMKKEYPELQSVLFVREVGSNLIPTDLFFRGASPVIEFYQSMFP